MRSLRSLFALLIYCIAFSFLFVCIYPFFFPDVHDADSPFERNKGSLIFNAAHQRSLQEANLAATTRSKSTHPPTPITQLCPEIPQPFLKYVPPIHSVPLTDREKVLAMCGQTEPMPLRDFFTPLMVATIDKLGEGAFADVFGCMKEDYTKLAIKMIPIEGDFKYNDEPQSSFFGVQPEIVVSLELSLLGEEQRRLNRSISHYTRNFMPIDRVSLCKGKFPDFLMDSWVDFDYRKKSDNDRPDVFSDNQLYVVYAAHYVGSQLGSFVYHHFHEAVSILRQLTATIAIGETALQFEHRDMHRGNVLVRRTKAKVAYFRLDGKDYWVPTYGVQATVVDYTLSRVRQGHCVSHTDLNKFPWLFRGKGDIQFDVYRDMRNETLRHWDEFHPKTNALWLNYIATKMSIKAKLKGPSTKTWKSKFANHLKQIKGLSSGREIFLEVFAPSIKLTEEEALTEMEQTLKRYH